MGTGPDAWWRCRRFRRLLLRSGLLTLLLVAPVVGIRVYGAVEDWRKESRLRLVEVGMTRMELLALAGSPDSKEQSENGESLWQYRTRLSISPRVMSFNVNSRVTQFRLDAEDLVCEVRVSNQSGHADCFEVIPLSVRLWWILRY